jgi:TldD protein
VLGAAVDAADIYFQLSRDESWSLEDGIVKEGSASIEQGVGVRALAGEKTGFAYSDEIVVPAIEEAARAARAIASAGASGRAAVLAPVRGLGRSTPPGRSRTTTRSPASSGSTARPASSTRGSCRSWPRSAPRTT